MRADTLKRKHPILWQKVESQVIVDFRQGYDLLAVAFNAAFIACSTHNELLKSSNEPRKLTKAHRPTKASRRV